MSDIIWAAIVAVVGSGLSGGIAAYTSSRVAKGQQGVELARLAMAQANGRQPVLDAERSNRQGTYHRLLAVYDRFDMYATGWPPADMTFQAALEELNFLVGGVLLFGAESVVAALGPVTTVFEEIGADMSRRPGSDWAGFLLAYADRREEVIAAQTTLIAAMRDDVRIEGTSVSRAVSRTGENSPQPTTTETA